MKIKDFNFIQDPFCGAKVNLPVFQNLAGLPSPASQLDSFQNKKI